MKPGTKVRVRARDMELLPYDEWPRWVSHRGVVVDVHFSAGRVLVFHRRVWWRAAVCRFFGVLPDTARSDGEVVSHLVRDVSYR